MFRIGLQISFLKRRRQGLATAISADLVPGHHFGMEAESAQTEIKDPGRDCSEDKSQHVHWQRKSFGKEL